MEKLFPNVWRICGAACAICPLRDEERARELQEPPGERRGEPPVLAGQSQQAQRAVRAKGGGTLRRALPPSADSRAADRENIGGGAAGDLPHEGDEEAGD